mgnify:CR=1 FL=1
MKKKILASLLLSTVLVSQGAILSTVKADNTDDKIAAQDSKISSLTAQQAEAQKLIKSKSKFQQFKLNKRNYKLKTILYKQNLSNLKEKLLSYQKTS